MLVGCIADDFTGATDVANMLVRGGLRTVQAIGVPEGKSIAEGADAIVVALKSRTVPAQEAVAQSLAALRWLREAGARQLYFKYCSTFDSTDAGNIGPVADALLDALGERFTIACPAFPAAGRTVFRGHLFVGDMLLSDSPMRHHPLTPMTDANLVRVLGRQTRRKVGLVPHEVVREGPQAIRAGFDRLRGEGVSYAVTDVVADEDLASIARACADLGLVTAGSGLAAYLPQNFPGRALAANPASLPVLGGPAAVLAGSCSAMTLRQVTHMQAVHPSIALDAGADDDPAALAARAFAAALPHLEAARPVLVYSSAPAEAVAELQRRHGKEAIAQRIEAAFAALARRLVAHGVRRLVVAGGETSGAVVSALGIRALAIGPQIDPGVPATLALGEPRLGLVLKSGNFGSADFFTKALEVLR